MLKNMLKRKVSVIVIAVTVSSLFSCMALHSWGKRKKTEKRSSQYCRAGCCSRRCCSGGSYNGSCKKSSTQEESVYEKKDKKSLKKRKNIDSESVIDVLICGSGPAGLSAATHAARARVKTVVIEGEIPGGQLMGTTQVENFPGYPSDVLGPDIIKNLREQAERFGPQFVCDYVEQIDFSLYPYKVTTKKGKKFYTRTIIIATGVTSSYLGVAGEKEYYSKGVSHCSLSEAPKYKDKDVVIVGGGDTAIEDTLQLASYAKNITLLVRSAKMRAIASSQEKLKELKNVSILYNSSVKEIIGDGDSVTGVTIEDILTGKSSVVPTSGVFIAIGCEPNSRFVKNVLTFDKDGYILVDGASQQTNIPGVFAAGDIVAGKVKLASVAIGSGTQAGFEAVKFLFDQEVARDTTSENNENNENKEKDYKVCFCKGVYYSEIVAAIRAGCKTFESLKKKLGLCSGCRSCKGTIENILKKELNENK